jgi:hypothetical protein
VAVEETDAQRQAYIEALLVERTVYVRYDKKDRVAAVDAELKRLGVSREDAHSGTERAVSGPAQKAVPAGRRRSKSE